MKKFRNKTNDNEVNVTRRNKQIPSSEENNNFYPLPLLIVRFCCSLTKHVKILDSDFKTHINTHKSLKNHQQTNQKPRKKINPKHTHLNQRSHPNRRDHPNPLLPEQWKHYFSRNKFKTENKSYLKTSKVLLKKQKKKPLLHKTSLYVKTSKHKV